MDVKDKRVLGLQLPTDPRWVNLAEMDLEKILTDHAYCELKAATTCISLIQLFSYKERLVEELTPVVSEEWSHFRMVLAELKKRNFTLGNQRKDEYVGGLRKFTLKGNSGHKPDALLADKLLMCALIEARSCERFRLLSLEISDESLRGFYHELMVSEAGHYKLFISLAKEYHEEEEVMARWKEWLAHEEQLLKGMEVRPDRMH